MGWLCRADLSVWRGFGRDFPLAHPAGDVAFLELDAGFVHGGTGLDFADLDALLVLAADAGFGELRGRAVEQDGDELSIDLVGACEAEIVREDRTRRCIRRRQVLRGEDGALPEGGVGFQGWKWHRCLFCMADESRGYQAEN